MYILFLFGAKLLTKFNFLRLVTKLLSLSAKTITKSALIDLVWKFFWKKEWNGTYFFLFFFGFSDRGLLDKFLLSRIRLLIFLKVNPTFLIILGAVIWPGSTPCSYFFLFSPYKLPYVRNCLILSFNDCFPYGTISCNCCSFYPSTISLQFAQSRN